MNGKRGPNGGVIDIDDPTERPDPLGYAIDRAFGMLLMAVESPRDSVNRTAMQARAAVVLRDAIRSVISDDQRDQQGGSGNAH